MATRKRITHDDAREQVDAIRAWGGDRARRLDKLTRYVDQQEAADCRMGFPCEKHHGITHGREAENLRAELEKLVRSGGDIELDIIENAVSLGALQRLLDDTDAGDSLAYLERKPKRRAKR